MRETGLGRTYMRTWIRLDDFPARNRMEPRGDMAEFYCAYLMWRWSTLAAAGMRRVRP
jgi:hypothetical protein